MFSWTFSKVCLVKISCYNNSPSRYFVQFQQRTCWSYVINALVPNAPEAVPTRKQKGLDHEARRSQTEEMFQLYQLLWVWPSGLANMCRMLFPWEIAYTRMGWTWGHNDPELWPFTLNSPKGRVFKIHTYIFLYFSLKLVIVALFVQKHGENMDLSDCSPTFSSLA